jgi:hypothetical protein
VKRNCAILCVALIATCLFVNHASAGWVRQYLSSATRNYVTSPTPAALVADLDRDGNMEVPLVGGSHLYIYDLVTGLLDYDSGDLGGTFAWLYIVPFHANGASAVLFNMGGITSLLYSDAMLASVAPGEEPAYRTSIRSIPNPTSMGADISFDMARAGRASLNVYDVSGRLVRTIMDGHLTQGGHSVHWDGADGNGNALAGGMYFYRLTCDGKIVESAKEVLLR